MLYQIEDYEVFLEYLKNIIFAVRIGTAEFILTNAGIFALSMSRDFAKSRSAMRSRDV